MDINRKLRRMKRFLVWSRFVYLIPIVGFAPMYIDGVLDSKRHPDAWFSGLGSFLAVAGIIISVGVVSAILAIALAIIRRKYRRILQEKNGIEDEQMLSVKKAMRNTNLVCSVILILTVVIIGGSIVLTRI